MPSLIRFFILIGMFATASQSHAQLTCVDIFSPPRAMDPFEMEQTLNEQIAIHCQSNCSPQRISRIVARTLQDFFEKHGISKAKARGYAILTATMVGSAAITSALTSSLPQNLSFLSLVMAQASTLGIYVMGAPIWEPLSSRFRKWAFGIQQPTEPLNAEKPLERLWQDTQGLYSLNAQMSRNIINSFILTAQRNFNEARSAIISGDRDLAVDQIAEAAIRLHRLFAEIPPEDPSVRLSIRTSFTRHIEKPEELRPAVLLRIQLLDEQALQSPHREFYHRVVDAWLAP